LVLDLEMGSTDSIFENGFNLAVLAETIPEDLLKLELLEV